jgi:flagellar hook protein FlgE
MGLGGLFAAATSGVAAFSERLASVAGNISNADTVGYKRTRVDFSTVLGGQLPDLASAVSAGAIGLGVTASARNLNAEQGSILRSATSTHVAVAGGGFFVVARDAAAGAATGDRYFTRAGDFIANAAGDLVNAAGYYLQGSPTDDAGNASAGALTSLETINIYRTPAGVDRATLGTLSGVSIGRDGVMTARYQNGAQFPIYRIPLALFANADGLSVADRTAMLATPNSGAARLAFAETGSAGAIEGAALESSTVDIGQEFSTLIETQRAYATNARVISTADAFWRTAASAGAR